MRQFTSDELRKAWKQFYIDRGHVDVGAVSLVSDGSTGVMFNVAGMQPLMPYLLGQKHPLGTRLCNVQGCVRTISGFSAYPYCRLCFHSRQILLYICVPSILHITSCFRYFPFLSESPFWCTSYPNTSQQTCTLFSSGSLT